MNCERGKQEPEVQKEKKELYEKMERKEHTLLQEHVNSDATFPLISPHIKFDVTWILFLYGYLNHS